MNHAIIEYWTPEECSAGLCAPDDIGKVKSPLMEARKLAQRATVKAVRALIDVAEQSDDLQAKVKAASALLDRGWGKPDQYSSNDVNVAMPIMPWIEARRLLYRESLLLADDIKTRTPADPPKIERDRS